MKTGPSKYLGTVLLLLFLSLHIGCSTVTLVQPYDPDLYSKTEQFYKKASEMIAKGISVSPKTSDDRNSIPADKVAGHPGHYNQFKSAYDALLIDVNSLILRSLATSTKVDAKAQEVHTKIEGAITENFPDECDDLQAEFSGVSLTVRNYIDLKCLIGKWGKQHQSEEITRSKLILKKSNWEGRSKTLFEAILAIQTAEAAKNADKN